MDHVIQRAKLIMSQWLEVLVLTLGRIMSLIFAYGRQVVRRTFWTSGEWMDLHLAILNFDDKVLKQLLNMGYDPNANCCSCLTEKFKSVTQFKEWRKYLPETLDHITPLHVAVLCNNIEALKILLRPRPTQKQIEIDLYCPTTGLTALHLACITKNNSAVDLLIRKGANGRMLRSKAAGLLGLTAFEMAFLRSDKFFEFCYDLDLYHGRRHQTTFINDYLSDRVDIGVIHKLIELGENVKKCYFQDGEDVFIKILKEYNCSNLIPLVEYMLNNHVKLTVEDSKCINVGVCGKTRLFPSLFDSRRDVIGKQRGRPKVIRKGYNCLGIVLRYCKRKVDRLRLVQLLIHHGARVDHLTTTHRSLIHLTVKSHYSSLPEIEFLVQMGVKIHYSDLIQAVECRRIDFFNYLLNNTNPTSMNLKVHCPALMSTLVLKSRAEDFTEKLPLTHYLLVLMNDHQLDPTTIGSNGKSLPLLYLLIFKNYLSRRNANHIFYEDAVKLIAGDIRIDLEFRPENFGTALTYATKLGQPEHVISMLVPGENKIHNSPIGESGYMMMQLPGYNAILRSSIMDETFYQEHLQAANQLHGIQIPSPVPRRSRVSFAMSVSPHGMHDMD